MQKRNGFSTISVLIALALIGSMSYVAYKAMNTASNKSEAYTNVRNDMKNIIKSEYNVYSQRLFYIPFGDKDPNTNVIVNGMEKRYIKTVNVNNVKTTLQTIISKDEDVNVKLLKCKDNQTKPVGFLVELHNNKIDENFYYNSCNGSTYKTNKDFASVEKKLNIVNNLSDVLPINNLSDDTDQIEKINTNVGDTTEENKIEYTKDDVCKYPLETAVGFQKFKKHFMHKGFSFNIHHDGENHKVVFNFDVDSNNNLCIFNSSLQNEIKKAIENHHNHNSINIDLNQDNMDSFLNYFQIPSADSFPDSLNKMKTSINTLKSIFDSADIDYKYSNYSNYKSIKTNNDNFSLFEYGSDDQNSIYFSFKRNYSWMDGKTCSKNFKIDKNIVGNYWWQWKNKHEIANFNYSDDSIRKCKLSITFSSIKDDVNGDGLNDIYTGINYSDNSNKCLEDGKFTYESFNKYLNSEINNIEPYLVKELYYQAYKPKIWSLYTCKQGWKVCGPINSFINEFNSATSFEDEDRIYNSFKKDLENNSNQLSELNKVYNIIKTLRSKAENKAKSLVSELDHNIKHECNPLTTWDVIDYSNLDLKEKQPPVNDDFGFKFSMACGSNAIKFIKNTICSDNVLNSISYNRKHHLKLHINGHEIDIDLSDIDLKLIPNLNIKNKIKNAIHNNQEDIDLSF